MAYPREMEEELSSRAVLKNEVKLALSLESEGKVYDEWVLDVFLNALTNSFLLR